MMQKAVPSDLFILKSPLPPLPKLGLRVITPELNPTPATDAFADHITKMLPFLWGKETGIWGRLPILFSEGVQKGRIDLNRFVALTATNHAKLYGMYPQKGTIAIGSDADLALWDPNKNVTITNDILQQGCDYSPYEGLQVKGWPVHTIVRGKTVVKDGEVTGQKGDGKYLARQKSNLVTSKPVWSDRRNPPPRHTVIPAQAGISSHTHQNQKAALQIGAAFWFSYFRHIRVSKPELQPIPAEAMDAVRSVAPM
jgi:hypothetical protein